MEKLNPITFNGGDGGTGPYKFSSMTGSTATLEPFTGYWDSSAITGVNVEATIDSRDEFRMG